MQITRCWQYYFLSRQVVNVLYLQQRLHDRNYHLLHLRSSISGLNHGQDIAVEATRLPFFGKCRLIRVRRVVRDCVCNGVQFHNIQTKRVLYEYTNNIPSSPQTTSFVFQGLCVPQVSL